jgi:AcrR family transcriptional regulator
VSSKSKKNEPPQDRRVRRTRRELRDALIALILERGWEAVSVQQVCERADVGRSTFYVHFADKEELLLSGFEELHAVLDESRRSRSGAFAFAEQLVAHAKDNHRLFKAIVGHRSGQAAQRGFRDLMLSLTEAELQHLDVDASWRTHAARYIAGGFVELLFDWVERPSGIDGAELTAMFREMVQGTLSTAKKGARLRPRSR